MKGTTRTPELITVVKYKTNHTHTQNTMASTRNRNSQEDYALETRRYQQHVQRMTHYESCGPTRFAGDGLLPGKYFSNTLLAGNATEIESQLYGIGSTNLTKPMQTMLQTAVFSPEVYQLKTLNMVDRPKVIMPESWEPLSHQRPFPSQRS